MTEKMRSVREVVQLTGITARTLHYYDEIGLLKPAAVTEAGYRMYGDAALSRLQTILLFRELEFPLKEIKAILDSPDFDVSEALSQQIRLLELQYKHLGELIAFTREIQNKGVTAMRFDVFDRSEIEQYEAEGGRRCGFRWLDCRFEDEDAWRRLMEKRAGMVHKVTRDFLYETGHLLAVMRRELLLEYGAVGAGAVIDGALEEYRRLFGQEKEEAVRKESERNFLVL